MPASLFEQHRRLVAMTEELLALVRRRPRAGIAEIGQLRARLGQLGIAHLQAEDALIMKPLLASGRAAEIPDVEAIITFVRAGRDYTGDHAARWTMQAVEEDREGYAVALERMVDFLHIFIAREEAELYRPVLQLLYADLDVRVH